MSEITSEGKINCTSAQQRWLFIDGASTFGGHQVMLLRWINQLTASTPIEALLVAREGSRLSSAAPPSIVSALLPPKKTQGRFAKISGNIHELRMILSVIRREKPNRCVIASGSLGDQVFLTTMLGLLRYPVLIYVPLMGTFTSMGYRFARWKDAFVRRWLARMPVEWLAISQRQAMDFRAWARPRGQVHVLSNTVALEVEHGGMITTRLLGDAAPLRVLVLGRLDAIQKGLDLLLDGLRAEPGDRLARFNFRIVGEGPYGDTLAEAVRNDTALTASVVLQAWGDTLKMLRDSDVLLLPSRFEGVPLVMLEALAVGLPVVASDLPGTREYLPDEVLFPVGDIAGAINILEGLRPVERRRSLAASGRACYDRQASSNAFARNVGLLAGQIGQGGPSVLLVDPSLFTAPYDAGLTEGLVMAGVRPRWAVRPVRAGDREEIAPEYVDDFFYRWIDTASGIPRVLRPIAKGVAHLWGMARLVGKVLRTKPDVVHFQWVVVPPLDIFAIAIIRLIRPVVLTVHDTVPFNGERISLMQNLAFDLPVRMADHVIVHTRAAAERLVQRGVDKAKVSVVRHGPLHLHAQPEPGFAASLTAHAGRKVFVLFGEIKRYKGLDVLVEALALLPANQRDEMRIVVAGRPRMELAPIIERIAELGLEAMFDIRAERLTEAEMAALFSRADCFLFPYRQIDASGVYFLAKSFGKWMIASRVGIFAEEMQDGKSGCLVTVESPTELASAMAQFMLSSAVPQSTSRTDDWIDIGIATRNIYARVSQERC